MDGFEGRAASKLENGTLQVWMRLSPSRFIQKSFLREEADMIHMDVHQWQTFLIRM